MARSRKRVIAASGQKPRYSPIWASSPGPYDDHSRLAHSEILPDEEDATCAAFLTRAADYFAGNGVPAMEAVMTDNAFAYRHSHDFHAAVTALGSTLVFVKAHMRSSRSVGSCASRASRSPHGPTGTGRERTVRWRPRRSSRGRQRPGRGPGVAGQPRRCAPDDTGRALRAVGRWPRSCDACERGPGLQPLRRLQRSPHTV